MTPDAFNADYWTAVAAVAPVLALANTVTMVSVGRTYLERKATEQRSVLQTEEAAPINIYGWRWRRRIALFNYLLQAIATTAALFSLADRHELVWSSLVAGLVVVSLVLIAWQAIGAGEDSVAEWKAKRLGG
jgi:hypothetical protein